jgi:sec-independent protein translocase protein TatA
MGLSGISFGELLLILVVLLLLFGSKKLPGMASDLGTAIRDFRRTFSNSQDTPEGQPPASTASQEPDKTNPGSNTR